MPPTNSNATIELVKNALGGANIAPELQKAGITTGTGLVAYDLQAPALSLVPVLTPIRNRLPRVKANGGTATNWKAITGINTAQLPSGVSEGNRGGVVATTTANYVASYAGLGLEDFVTFEADYAAEGFDDVKAKSVLNLLRALMISEERNLLGGNTSLALGVTPTPTVTTSTTGGSIGATVTVSVICVALTQDGYRRSSMANGIPAAAITRTNADGSSDSINPGVAGKSTNASVATGAGSTNSVSASVAAVPGAAGYAWFAGTAGSERIAAITSINSVLIQSVPGSGQLASACSATDLSTNQLIFDGLLTFAFKNGGYVQALATGTPGTGATLTSNGAGGIAEIDTAFKAFWDSYRLSPTRITVNSQESLNITKKVVANSGAPLYRLTQDATGTHTITGGMRVEALLNSITGQMVPVEVHPDQTPGTILFEADEIPYPLSGVPNPFQVKTRREYYQLEWPLRSRKYEYGCYVDEVLQVYAPFALGVIYNIANG